MRSSNFHLSIALLAFAAVGVAAADDNTDFFLNVFSDVGPILALFGDEFARQFLSETFTNFDHLIFACVPLGIMTALTGAIRAQGPKFARAFIGRARENRAAVEMEFMTSTSHEVCEMFNGESIVRTVGRPNIAQLIIFPGHDTGADKSCGIHTLQTAADPEVGVMTYSEYHSTFQFSPLKWLKGIRKASPDSEQGKWSRNEPLYNSLDFLGPPNFQLNFPPRKTIRGSRVIESILATIIAITLQTSLVIIAVIAVYHKRTRESIGYNPQPWGLPCYVIGSILLFISMLICSTAIERSTVELKWRPREDSDEPQIIWIQRSQRVNDQDFDSYVIYGGPNSYILTSSRQEEVTKCQRPVAGGEDRGNEAHQYKAVRRSSKVSKWWEVVTIIGSLAGGIGFTIQFIGLRGLPWPCAVSQLGGLFAMAIIRAWIRRRLGEVPHTCQPPQGYELDFLATQIVYNGESIPKYEEKTVVRTKSTELVWQVRTASPDLKFDSFPFHQLNNDWPRNQERNNAGTGDSRPQKGNSRQLIRVRERLGSLCGWNNSVLKSAQALEHAIKRFMDEFLRDRVTPIEWVIQAGDDNSDDHETVVVPISKQSHGNTSNGSSRWAVDLGKIEAILSLWIASIEVQEMKKSKPPRQLTPGQTQTSIDSRVNYLRIIGNSNENHVLMRDISWWVSNQTATEMVSLEDKKHGFEPDDVKIVIGFTEPKSQDTSHPQTKGKTPQILLRDSSADLATIAVQHLFTSFMWNITEYLPTDCLGQGDLNALQKLVKVQSSNTSDLQSSNGVGLDLELSHTNLTSFVKYAEEEGLGTSKEILLCMIPAFSFRDILPNDAVFKHFVPQDVFKQGRRKWAKSSIRYNHFFDSSEGFIGTNAGDYLTLVSVVDTMEFVYLMALDYLSAKPKYIESRSKGTERRVEGEGSQGGESEKETMIKLDPELRKLLVSLSKKFSVVLKKLSPIYDLQGRRDTFKDIFSLCPKIQPSDHWWNIEWSPKIRQMWNDEQKFLERIGFGDLHRHICGLKEDQDMPSGEPELMVKQDIFGWSPLHYAAGRRAIRVSSKDSDSLVKSIKNAVSANRWLDKFKRSPIHTAASSGNHDLLESLLKAVEEAGHISTVDSGGMDGMRPIHLAVKGRHDSCVRVLLELPISKAQFDAWKRSPIHISAIGYTFDSPQSRKTVALLLEKQFSPDALDIFGKTPLSYLNEKNDKEKELGRLLLKNWTKFGSKDGDGQSVLHHAIRFSDEDQAKKLILKGADVDATNKRGETPLHIALSFGQDSLATVLLKHGARPSIKDQRGLTPLMLACQLAKKDIIMAMLKKVKRASDDDDRQGKTALHYALEFKHLCSPEDLEDIVRGLANAMDNIDIQDRAGRTPLHYAVAVRDSIASILLEKKADPKIKDDNGRDVLHHTAASGETGNEESQKSLMSKLLAAADSNIDEEDGYGQTPLHVAIISNNFFIASTLLNHGASPKIKDYEDKSALHHAVVSTEINRDLTVGDNLLSRIVKMMKEFIDEREEAGKTPLQSAVSEGNENTALLLLSEGANPHTMGSSGKTPLMTACETNKCHSFIANTIRDGSSELVNQGDSTYDFSPLALACHEGHADVVKILLGAGSVDRNRKAARYHGYTPLHIALLRQNEEIVSLLLDDNRIDESWNIADDNGALPLEFAIAHFNEACLKALLLHPNAGFQRFSKSVLSTSDLGDMISQVLGTECEQILYDAWEDRILSPTRGQARLSLHKMAELGKTEKVLLSVQNGANALEYDEDNWTPADVARRYCHNELEKSLQEYTVSQVQRTNRPPFRKPSSFTNSLTNAFMELAHCQTHGAACQGSSIEAKVSSQAYHEDRIFVFRTQECIPPNVRHFYFEVEILRHSINRLHAVGFSQSFVPHGILPGCYLRSWAYHRDGTLYTGSGRPYFQGVNKNYEEGHVVGCGINMETGEGYRTLNGERLGSGGAFDKTKFLIGKLYPCIAFISDGRGDKPHVRVTLSESELHQFRYRGPYE